jgi:hypothetical protein
VSPLAVASIVAALVVAGALLGGYLRGRVPGHHLTEETKFMVKIGIEFVTMLAALVLGLLVASAKSTFDDTSAAVEHAAAKIAQLDINLRQLGSVADPAREMLRRDVSARVDTIWGSGRGASAVPAVVVSTADVKDLESTLRAIAPSGEAQRLAWSKSLQLTDELAQLTTLARARSGSAITMPLLVLLVFWLAAIAVGMSLFAPRNGTVLAINVLCALSSAGAIFLILEMDRPFGGIVHISADPLRAVLVQMSR